MVYRVAYAALCIGLCTHVTRIAKPQHPGQGLTLEPSSCVVCWLCGFLPRGSTDSGFNIAAKSLCLLHDAHALPRAQLVAVTQGV